MRGLKAIPNLLTSARIVLAVGVFALLARAGADPGATPMLAGIAFAAFVVAALTDWFDGWLARRLQAQSPWGTALDPIADKIAVLAVVLGPAAGAPAPGPGRAGVPDPVSRDVRIGPARGGGPAMR